MFDIVGTLDVIEARIKNIKAINRVYRGQLRRPPGERVTATIFMFSGPRVAITTLASPIEIHVAVIRIMSNQATQDTAAVEERLADATAEVMTALYEGFSLDSTVRNVDIGGQHGQPLNAEWGSGEEWDTLWRWVDITVPVIVDDSAEFDS